MKFLANLSNMHSQKFSAFRWVSVEKREFSREFSSTASGLPLGFLRMRFFTDKATERLEKQIPFWRATVPSSE